MNDETINIVIPAGGEYRKWAEVNAHRWHGTSGRLIRRVHANCGLERGDCKGYGGRLAYLKDIGTGVLGSA